MSTVSNVWVWAWCQCAVELVVIEKFNLLTWVVVLFLWWKKKRFFFLQARRGLGFVSWHQFWFFKFMSPTRESTKKWIFQIWCDSCSTNSTVFSTAKSGLHVLYECHIRVTCSLWLSHPGSTWYEFSSVCHRQYVMLLGFSIRSLQLRYGACLARFGGPSRAEDVSKDNMARCG